MDDRERLDSQTGEIAHDWFPGLSPEHRMILREIAETEKLLKHANNMYQSKYHEQPQGDRDAISLLAESLRSRLPNVHDAAIAFVRQSEEVERIVTQGQSDEVEEVENVATQEPLPLLDHEDALIDLMIERFEHLNKICEQVHNGRTTRRPFLRWKFLLARVVSLSGVRYSNE